MKRSLFNLIAGVGMTLASLAAANAQVVAIRTLAGTATPGATNGFGSNARFNHPSAIAADAAGNVYIADTENGTIRKISSDGFVSTFAGLAGNYGSADGGGATARFFGPEGIVADNSGQVFVADTANSTIRKITAAGVVSTFAGAAGVSNSLDGAAANARFFHPEGLALDAGGNLYVADTWNHTIRRITPGGIVTTLAGSA
jgi:DNA-binding beta-propeller fold protein YncE